MEETYLRSAFGGAENAIKKVGEDQSLKLSSTVWYTQYLKYKYRQCHWEITSNCPELLRVRIFLKNEYLDFKFYAKFTMRYCVLLSLILITFYLL